MDIETYKKATELYNKYQLCEKVLVYLSDPDINKGQAYLDTLRRFVAEYNGEFMMFVNKCYIDAGMEFESLHCECRPDETPDDGTEEPEIPVS